MKKKIPTDSMFRTRGPKKKAEKEQLWDSRFIFQKMSEYDAFSDYHCIGYLASFNRQRSLSKKKDLGSPKPRTAKLKVKKRGAVAAYQNQESIIEQPGLPKRLPRGRSILSGRKALESYTGQPGKTIHLTKQDLNLLFAALEETWGQAHINEDHRTCYRAKIDNLSLHEKSVAIVKEMEDIEKRCEPLQILGEEAKKREKAAEEVLEFVKKIGDPKKETPGIKGELVNLLRKLRKATLRVLRFLNKWRIRIKNKEICYMQDGTNILVRIERDYNKLINSPLKEVFPFATEYPDVLFLSPDILKINSKYFEKRLQGSPAKEEKSIEAKLKIPMTKELLPKFVKAQKRYELEIKTTNIISPLTLDEDNLNNFLIEYFKDISEGLITSFGEPAALIKRAFSGVNPQWIYLKRNANDTIKKATGLCVYCKDVEAINSRRLEILHISGCHCENLPWVIRAFLNHLWTTTNASEIRIKQFQKEVAGNFVYDKEFQDLLVKKFQFKWVHLTNDLERYTVLATPRPKSITAGECECDLSTPAFSFNIDHLVMLGKETDKEPIPTERKFLFWAAGNVISIMYQLKLSGEESIPKGLKHEFKEMSKIKGEIPSTKAINGAALGKMNSSLENQQLQLPPEIVSSLKKDSESFCSLFSLSGNWKASSSLSLVVETTKFLFLNIRGDSIVKLTSKSKKKQIILVPTDDERVTAMIYTSENLEEKAAKYSSEELYNHIKHAFNKLAEKAKPESSVHSLYLPQFRLKISHRMPIVESLKLGEEKQIEKAVEFADLKFESDPRFASTITPHTDNDDVLINNSFVFGLIHHRMEHLPLFLSYITKDEWIKWGI